MVFERQKEAFFGGISSGNNKQLVAASGNYSTFNIDPDIFFTQQGYIGIKLLLINCQV